MAKLNLQNDLTKTVIEMGQVKYRGTYIDGGWLYNLTFDNGKPHYNAIFILADICYWYTPTEIKDEVTGMLIGYKKKFKADKLQRNYEAFAKKFNITKRQAKDACHYLVEKNLITIEFRDIILDDGRIMNNVMFVEPIPENIKKISSLYMLEDHFDDSNNTSNDCESNNKSNNNCDCNNKNVNDCDSKSCEQLVEPLNNGDLTPPPTIERTTSYDGTYHPPATECTTLLQQNVPLPTTECKTNTYTTTSTTTSISTSISQSNKKEIVKEENIIKKLNNANKKIRLMEINRQIENLNLKTYKELLDSLQLDQALEGEEKYKNWINPIKRAIYEMYYQEETKINNVRINQYELIEKLQNINIDIVIASINKIIEASQTRKINHIIGFLKVVIYNCIDEYCIKDQLDSNYNPKESKKYIKPNRFHNLEQRTNKYSAEELENIAKEKREKYYSSKTSDIDTLKDKRDISFSLLEKYKGTPIEKALLGIKNELTECSYNAYFEKGIVDINIENDDLNITFISNFIKGIIELRYLTCIESNFKLLGIKNINLTVLESKNSNVDINNV